MEKERESGIGDRFKIVGEAEEWLLAQVGYGKVCLIGLESGNRRYEPVKVNNAELITEGEMDKILKGVPTGFASVVKTFSRRN